jgi:hypothetical protein
MVIQSPLTDRLSEMANHQQAVDGNNNPGKTQGRQ